MKRSLAIKAISFSLLLGSGCQAPADNSAQLQQLEARITILEQRIEALASQPSAPTVENAAPANATPVTNSATGAEPLWKTLSYTNLPSPEKLQEIVSLGFLPQLGITDQKSFEGDLTRGQYVAMLVEMNNLLQDDTQKIRLAREGDGQAFDDVPPSHPQYKYIQGMVDAGYVIGFNEKSFQPDKLLTREEMVAIAAKRDFDFDGFDSKYFWEHYAAFTDKEEIAPKYRDAVSKDFAEISNSNLRQAFGELKLFHPKKNVKVYEAVLSLQGVGGYSNYNYEEKVSKAMGKDS